MPRLSHERGVIRAITVVLAILAVLALVSCGESEEEKAMKALRGIYADNVDGRVAKELDRQGKPNPTYDEYRVVCGLWDDFDYLHVNSASEDELYDMVLAYHDWREDEGATMGEMERLQDVWIGVSSVTRVLSRDLDTIFHAKDFCEHHTD